MTMTQDPWPRRAKMTYKNRKKYRIFMFWSAGCSLLRAEGFFCSVGVLYGGLGISKLQFLIKKIKIKISSCNFFLNFRPSNTDLVRDQDAESGSAIRKNAGYGSVSGSALNQCGFATLIQRVAHLGALLAGAGWVVHVDPVAQQELCLLQQAGRVWKHSSLPSSSLSS